MLVIWLSSYKKIEMCTDNFKVILYKQLEGLFVLYMETDLMFRPKSSDVSENRAVLCYTGQQGL